MNRVVICLVVAGIVWAGGGCGESDRPAGTEVPAGKPRKQLVIGVTVPAADHGWTAGVGWWARRAMELYPEEEVRFVYATADTPEKQTADIKDMMAQQKLDGMVVLATESEPLTPMASQVHDNGIYLISVDRGFTKPVADVFIEGDNEAFGRKAAEFICEKLDGQGNIVVLEGIPSTVNTDRVEAATEVFDRYPGVKILGQQPGMWSREKAHSVMKNFLAQFDNIDAVWAADDDMALGVEQAIREAGAEGRMWTVGGGGMKEVVRKVMDGDPMYPATVTYPPSMIAVGIHMCVSNLRDGNVEAVSDFMPRHMKLDVELITPENAEEYYFPESIY